MTEPAIVVIAYNREHSLDRLLNSLAKASYPSENITLHISIDASENEKVKQVADAFEWKHGEKNVDVKPEKFGLLKHVLSCVELTNTYESIIVLEDDLIVADGFYQYAQTANDFFGEDEKVAGVSLFAYSFEENNFYPFQPIQDESDVHFIQIASSWGQLWNKDQWSKFKLWLTENPTGKDTILPDYILEWGNNSWKKLFITYLIEFDRYFVFPNASYTSNFEEEGTHATQTGLFQVPMTRGVSKPRLKKWSESNSIYDVYFELIPSALKQLKPELNKFNFEVDLYGGKAIQSSQAEFLLTSHRGRNAVKSFGAEMKPLIQNILFGIEGDEIGLYRKKNLLPTEKNRFSLLHSASVQLDQQAATRRLKIERVTIIIPVLETQLDDLRNTIDFLKSDRFYNLTVLIVCSPKIENLMLEITATASLEIEIVTSDSEGIDDLLRFGIAKCSTDYCSWMQPGMSINLDRVEDVAQIFRGMSQVQILHGLEGEADESKYLKLNTASGRWTPQRANSNKEEAGKVRSEFVFWRKSLISDEAISKLSSENLFLELLKLSLVYVVALKLGDTKKIKAVSFLSKDEVATSLNKDQYQAKKGVRAITRPIFHYWFRRNVPFFRLFYRETEKLPLVIRYDFNNKSFYLDNY